MGKYDVTYSCGHTGVRSFSGSYKARERKLEWYREYGLCPQCAKAERDEQGPGIIVRVAPPRPDGQRLFEVVVIRSYQFRDLLKARDYEYGRHFGPTWGATLIDRMINSGTPGWRKTWVLTDAERCGVDGDAIGAELDWLQSQGWLIEAERDPITGLFDSLAEGRPELAGIVLRG